MKLYRPASVLQIALFAFALVGVPLSAALVAAKIAVDRLASQGSRAVMQSAQVIEIGSALVSQFTAMERNARQYAAIGDRELLGLYEQRRKEFMDTVVALRGSPHSPGQLSKLEALEAGEAAIWQTLNEQEHTAPELSAALDRFPELGRTARSILGDSSHVIGAQLAAMRLRAEETQRLLTVQASALIPLVVVLAAVGTLLIVRPLRQMDRVIRRLGDGRFDEPVQIRGPRDVEELGERLDWLRARLHELDEQKAQFLRHVSHELKTPLTALREGAQLLSDEVVGTLNDAQADIAHILSANSVRLQRRIEDLLNFSVISHGDTPPLVLEDVDPVAVVEEVLRDHAVTLRARRIRIERQLEPATLQADAGKLRVVVDNLVSNAIKFSPREGRIRVSVGHDAGWTCIEVADEGPGIAPDERQQIFEPFYQGHARQEGHVKGTGLGLAIAREYVLAHGGSLAAGEPPWERGACLTVRLPRPETSTLASEAKAS
jgi:two-component system sensor histidine kinase GlrK